MSKLWRQCVETDNHNQDPLTCLTGVSFLELGHGGIWHWISLGCPTYFISLLFSAVKHSVADYVRSLLSCNNRLFECNQRLKFCSHYIAGPLDSGPVPSCSGNFERSVRQLPRFQFFLDFCVDPDGLKAWDLWKTLNILAPRLEVRKLNITNTLGFIEHSS
jgi:hypothetical protein